MAPIQLRLSPSDAWRTHGGFNVILALVGVGIVLVSPFCMLVAPRLGALGMLVGTASCLTSRRTLRSLLAIVSHKPFVGIGDDALTIDGGLCDRWYLAWSDIEAMAPEPHTLRQPLARGDFVALSVRTRTERARWGSVIQHSAHPRILEIGARFEPVSSEEVDRLVALLEANVVDRQAYLLHDME